MWAEPLIGVLVLGVIDNGLILLNVNSDWQLVAVGAILIVAVALDRNGWIEEFRSSGCPAALAITSSVGAHMSTYTRR